MSQRAFIIALVLLAAVVMLSATRFPGGMIGFLFAMGGVMLAIPGMAIADAFTKAGAPISINTLVWLLAALYALLALVTLFQTLRLTQRRDMNEARLAALRLAVLLALPLMGWLSTNAMARSWP